jgi:hypothetical protein
VFEQLSQKKQMPNSIKEETQGPLEWLLEIDETHPPLVDRELGSPPVYRHWPLDAKGDLKYLAVYREPVRSSAHWVEYTIVSQHVEYPAGTKCRAWRNRHGGLFLLMEDGVLLMLSAGFYLAGIEEESATTFSWPTSPYMRALGDILCVKDLIERPCS